MPIYDARSDLRAQTYLAESIGEGFGLAIRNYMEKKKQDEMQRAIVSVMNDPYLSPSQARNELLRIRGILDTRYGQYLQMQQFSLMGLTPEEREQAIKYELGITPRGGFGDQVGAVQKWQDIKTKAYENDDQELMDYADRQLKIIMQRINPNLATTGTESQPLPTPGSNALAGRMQRGINSIMTGLQTLSPKARPQATKQTKADKAIEKEIKHADTGYPDPSTSMRAVIDRDPERAQRELELAKLTKPGTENQVEILKLQLNLSPEEVEMTKELLKRGESINDITLYWRSKKKK